MQDPIEKFSHWLDEAKRCPGISEPTAMTLATASMDARPSARIVLLKSHDAAGFTFFTNTQSRKGDELHDNPLAALVFYWMPLNRQVRIEGGIARVGDAEADAYFATRLRLKQAGAWASLQSQPLDARETLLARTQAIEAEYAGREIPRPPHWSGYRLNPERIEFWEQQEGRLHIRDLYTRAASGEWQCGFLYP